MRLHRLTVTAIGPFADTQHIDFERLGEGGLFLLEGPTGAGKSTVLDAITFALFGGVASEDADSGRLHSHFADEDVRPEVQLEFSVSGTTLRVTRNPAYQRSKMRGSGTTVEKSAAHLQRRVDGTWESVSDKQDEIGVLVEQQLGLNRAQFTQVVLLPQGEFARFLRADDDARRKLLTKIFGAQRFDHITSWLELQAKAARGEQREAEVRIGEVLSAAIEAGHVPNDISEEWRALTARWLPGAADQLNSAMAAYGADLTARCESATLDQTAAEMRQREVSVRLAALRQESERIQQRKVALQRQATHRKLAEEYSANVGRLAAARRAGTVEPLVDVLSEARSLLAVAELRAESAAGGETSDVGSDWEVLRTQGQGDMATAASLAELAKEERGIPARRREIEDIGEQIKGADRRRATLAVEAEELPARIARGERAVADAQQASARIDGLNKDLETWRIRLEAVRSIADLKPQRDVAVGLRTAAIDRHIAAVDEHQGLMQARLDGMTGELAATLIDGVPCHVCGSTEHPAPAPSAVGQVTADQIEAAATRRDEALKDREAAEASYLDIRTLLLQEEVRAGNATLEEASSSVERLTRELAAARETAENGDEPQEELTQLRSRSGAISAETNEISELVAALTARRRSLTEDLESDTAAIAEAARGRATVADRITELEASARRLLALADATKDLAAARERCREAEAAALTAAEAQGFDALDGVSDALMSVTALDQLEKAIAAWEAEEAAVNALLTTSEQMGVDVAREAEVTSALGIAQDALRVADEALQEAIAHREQWATRLTRFTERSAEVQQCLAAREDLSVSHAALIDMDSLARGVGNAVHRMTLTTYVLRLWFELVVQAANTRLQRIAGGKFELRRTEESGNALSRVGLGLSVFDRHTGKERSPKSLSGGETFYTSLALALGLADVVQGEAGGASLQTLFIDEGFGSLDSDTLEEVLNVIDSLRDNGRTVGIVSHVDELKERVPERLEVRRLRPDGPSVVRVLA